MVNPVGIEKIPIVDVAIRAHINHIVVADEVRRAKVKIFLVQSLPAGIIRDIVIQTADVTTWIYAARIIIVDKFRREFMKIKIPIPKNGIGTFLY